MVTKHTEEETKNGATDEEDFKPAEPMAEGFDLTSRFPQWDPADGVPIRGFMLGSLALPSTIANQDFWHVYAVKLTADTKANVVDADDPKNKKKQTLVTVRAGEIVLVTVTAALSRIAREVNNPRYMREVYIAPGPKTRTKNGYDVQTFSSLKLGKMVGRKDEDRLPAIEEQRGLPSTASDAADIPF